jgi:hypothetical protein
MIPINNDLFKHTTANNNTPGVTIMTQRASEHYDIHKSSNKPNNNPAFVAKIK